ncbi:MAG: hypothetical protein FWE31_05110 [Firmicutes bacterium]|nr:hypothetical protein [Bacillota bacterium]
MMRFIFAVCLVTMVAVIPFVVVGCRYRQEFSYENFTATLTQEASDELNSSGRLLSPEDFPDVELSEVRNLFTDLGQRRILIFTLKHPGRQNIMDAVALVNAREDIQHASLDFISERPA